MTKYRLTIKLSNGGIKQIADHSQSHCFLCPLFYSEGSRVGPAVRRLPEPAGGPGRPDADSVGQSQGDPAGAGHAVQLPVQDSRPHHQGEKKDPAGNINIRCDVTSALMFVCSLSVSQPIGKAVVGERMAVEISFTNPLPQVLKRVIFHIEGLGLLTAKKINYG